jgi:FG-GAP-like repeat
VYAADLDGDGDLDVLTASYWDSTIAWYENTGGGGFGSKQVITNSASHASTVYADDVDSDGDMDVMSASMIDSGPNHWFENAGGGNFSAKKVLTP